MGSEWTRNTRQKKSELFVNTLIFLNKEERKKERKKKLVEFDVVTMIFVGLFVCGMGCSVPAPSVN